MRRHPVRLNLGGPGTRRPGRAFATGPPQARQSDQTTDRDLQARRAQTTDDASYSRWAGHVATMAWNGAMWSGPQHRWPVGVDPTPRGWHPFHRRSTILHIAVWGATTMLIARPRPVRMLRPVRPVRSAADHSADVNLFDLFEVAPRQQEAWCRWSTDKRGVKCVLGWSWCSRRRSVTSSCR